ncbi:metal binding Ada-like protein [Arcicella aurantiaca]|uniref:Metal binding Ada-like protein n=1 Tax=Arcicella aurantiaca TaxID=591202 RepID=A0A316DG26_9BACT|nr:Ada metal-binding domain-containing protein [Arcicella aurantiaca]PWK16865.1 metal binding Ada-like protein [Arcicella aurantiaca]
MIKHLTLSNTKFGRSKALKMLINFDEISIGGNAKLKIYGTLKCSSGKRMNIENRVFFKNETEAILAGFRPCGHCMRDKYLLWKSLN